MSDNKEDLVKFGEYLLKLDPDCENILSIIKEGSHREAYEQLKDILSKTSYSQPKAWEYFSFMYLRQAAAYAELSAMKSAEQGYKTALDMQVHIFDDKEKFFLMSKDIISGISNYYNIIRLKIKKNTADEVIKLTEGAKYIFENGYNSTRQKEQLSELQGKIDKAKEQGKISISTAAVSEMSIYEHIVNTVKSLDAYSESSIETAELIGRQLSGIEDFDKEYLVERIPAALQNMRETLSEMISLSRTAIDRRKEREREEANNRYWAEHAEEKADLDRRLEEAKKSMNEIDEQLLQCEKDYAEISKKREKFKSEHEDEKLELEKDIKELNEKIDNLGRFKGKEKKNFEVLIEEFDVKLEEVNKQIELEKKAYNEGIDAELQKINDKKQGLAAKDNEITAELKYVKKELSKDHSSDI